MMPPAFIGRLVVALLLSFERDDVFFPIQIVLVPSIVVLAGLVWGTP